MSRVPAGFGEEAFDLIVIGAGVNGAGIARDASMRGLRVLLLDKDDLASGTTAWSTRLIHGGLRYLEHGELSLVRESLRERATLLSIAPHLVCPLQTLVPLYEGARRAPLTLRAGLLAYDLLSFDKSLPRHRQLSRAETLERAPSLNPDGLRGALLYFDAQAEFPERLVVENVLSARAHGATVFTHAPVERFIIEGGAVRGVVFRHALCATGTTHEARAAVTVNAAGPWVDEVLSRAPVATREKGDGSASLRQPMLDGTKGSHLVVAPFAGAPASCAIYAEARSDARPFFVIPWNANYLVGTTDRRFAGDPGAAVADEEEINYLLREANALLAGASLTRADVLFTYSGVRPLARSRVAAADNHSEAGITRRHFVRDHAPELPGLLSVVGGKLTVYRSLSQRVVDEVFRRLGRRSPACRTHCESLPGALTPAGDDYQSFAANFKARSGLSAVSANRLLRVYGTRAEEVLRLIDHAPELGATLGESGALKAEVVHAFRAELAETLVDCLWRRAMAGFNASAREAAEAAEVGRAHLGWDGERVEREVSAYAAYVRRFNSRAGVSP